MALMKLHLPAALLAVVVTIFVAPLDSRAQSTLTNGAWNTTISSAEGGAKSLISFTAPDWATNGFFSPYAPGSGFYRWPVAWTGFLGAASNAWSFAITNFVIAPVGYTTNQTDGTSFVMDEIVFESYGSGQGVISVGASNNAIALSSDPGDVLQIIFSNTPTEVLIDLPFSNFNQGTYNAVDNFGTQFNLEIVPEPTTYALLALSAAGLGGYVVRRRRK